MTVSRGMQAGLWKRRGVKSVVMSMYAEDDVYLPAGPSGEGLLEHFHWGLSNSSVDLIWS